MNKPSVVFALFYLAIKDVNCLWRKSLMEINKDWFKIKHNAYDGEIAMSKGLKV